LLGTIINYNAQLKALLKTALKKILPWIFCLAIFYYIFQSIPPKQFYESLKLVNVTYFILAAVMYFLSIHALDCFTLKHFISRFSAPISHKESWLVRGVSYFIMVINYHAAQGAFAIYFKKTHKAPIAKTLGTLAFISITDLILVFTSALIAFTISDFEYISGGYDLKSITKIAVPLIYAFYILWILFWRNVDKPYLNRVKQYKAVNWILKHDIFLIFREAQLKDYLIVFLMRLPLIIFVIGGYNLSVYAFSAQIDWGQIFLFMPIVMFITTLPITPAGFGTGQYFTIEFFENTVSSPLIDNGLTTPAALLLASSLVWGIANQIIKLVFGLYSISRTSRELFTADE